MTVFKLDDNGKWIKETKEEVMLKEDIEGKNPCEKCWELARDNGIYSWPLLPEKLAEVKRCEVCQRVI